VLDVGFTIPLHKPSKCPGSRRKGKPSGTSGTNKARNKGITRLITGTWNVFSLNCDVENDLKKLVLRAGEKQLGIETPGNSS
jgi:hypothetical protein